MLCCAVSRRVAVCCVVLWCVVWCGGGVWPPSWSGVLRWCPAPRTVGRAVFGCGVLCCVASCVGWCVAPSWWSWLRWCVVPLMVGHGVLCDDALRCGVLCCVPLCGLVVVCGPPHGGVCCVEGPWVVLCGVVCRCGVRPPYGGAWCTGVWPASWLGVLRQSALRSFVWLCGAVCCVWCWCVAPLVVGRAALVCGPPHGRAVVRCIFL